MEFTTKHLNTCIYKHNIQFTTNRNNITFCMRGLHMRVKNTPLSRFCIEFRPGSNGHGLGVQRSTKWKNVCLGSRWENLMNNSRSEGFPLTCDFIPGLDGTGVWTTGNLCRHLPPFLQRANTNDMTGLIRPACGEQKPFKINRISLKLKNDVFQLVAWG